VTKIGGPAGLALLSLALGVAASPDLPLEEAPRVLAILAAALTVVLVIALLDRRAPRRVMALGVATLAAALGYDALRAERGTVTLAAGEAAQSFARTDPRGGAGPHALRETIVLDAIEPDGTAVLRRSDGAAVRVSPERAVRVGDYRLGRPRPLRDASTARPVAMAMTVRREPAALLAGLGLLIAAIGVAWSRW
jgi:hypothetical protein